MTVPFIFCASITAISAIISLGFSIVAALGATGTARTLALYACARSMALVIASVVPFQTGSTEWLKAIAWSMIIVQACDAFIGTTIKDRMKTFGFCKRLRQRDFGIQDKSEKNFIGHRRQNGLRGELN
jgi:hypothetical protein